MTTMFGDNLLIKEYPAGIANVATLRAHIASLRMAGFTPDVVCLDYINLLAPPTRSDSRYEGLGQVYVDLIGLAKEYDLWMFTAAQSNRTGFESNLITMQVIAESFQGAMHSDVIISLNRDDEESNREYIRLYIAKDRNGVDKKVIGGYTNFRRGSFWKRN